MSERRHDLYLLTPGPLTVSQEVKREMLADRSPNAALHAGLTRKILDYMLDLSNGHGTHAAVPIQGSATYGIEAALHTLLPKSARLLIIKNGFYGLRLVEVAEGIGKDIVVLELPMLPPPTYDDIANALKADPSITHAIVCYVDTGTGVLNPLEPIAEACKAHGVKLMVDAVAAFGGFKLDVKALDVEAVMISPNKCLESVPGVGIVIARKSTLETSAKRSPSVVLDLHAQWAFFEEKGWWRTTPPTHVIAALAKAIDRHKAEGGIEARQARYVRNWRRLVDTLRQRGFRTLLPDEHAAPIIATFHDPDDPNYSFQRFYEAMEKRGIVIFPGRLTAANTFRIGCMGDLDDRDMSYILSAIDEALTEIGVVASAPRPEVAA
jgi:2-aminoethylphosphonate-pyruvate transaminase